MSQTSWQTVLLVMALFLLLPAAAAAQGEKTSGPQSSPAENSKAAKTPGRLSLQTVTLINTAEAARKAAEEASAKTQASRGAARDAGKSGAKQETGGAVLEFRPTEGLPAAVSAPETVQAKHPKKSVLKNIHGSAYGATASAVGQANGEAGAVGADSSNGKFNIYVEGEHGHASAPAPH